MFGEVVKMFKRDDGEAEGRVEGEICEDDGEGGVGGVEVSVEEVCIVFWIDG